MEWQKGMMERRKNNILKKEERQKMMERRMDKYEKEYGEKDKRKDILYYWSLIINCN